MEVLHFNTAVPGPAQEILKGVIESDVLPSTAYLAGGTAIAIYYGHRLSEDFDLFTPEDLNLKQITEGLNNAFHKVEYIYQRTNTIIAYLYKDESSATKCSLFKFPYELIEKPLMLNHFPGLEEYPLKVASITDLICMKITAIAQRGSAKDFVDLKWLLSENRISLKQAFDRFKEKYGVSDSFWYQFNTGLRYFYDAEKEEEWKNVTLYDRSSRKYRTMTEKEWENVKKYFIELTA